jgi:hypothetical protein
MKIIAISASANRQFSDMIALPVVVSS